MDEMGYLIEEKGCKNIESPIEQEYLTLIYEAVQSYRNNCVVVFRGQRLSPNAFAILRFLCRHPRIDKAADIARYCGFSTSLASRSIDGMVRQGILDTVRDEQDRRINHVRIREECKEIEKLIADIDEKFYQDLTRGIPAEELAVFFDVFRRMMLNLKEKGVDA